jgi:hypothetical protein
MLYRRVVEMAGAMRATVDRFESSIFNLQFAILNLQYVPAKFDIAVFAKLLKIAN